MLNIIKTLKGLSKTNKQQITEQQSKPKVTDIVKNEYNALETILKKYQSKKNIEQVNLKIKDNHVVYLNLMNYDLKKIPEEVQQFSHLKEIDLSWNDISKIANLDNLPIKTLRLGWTHLTSLDNLDNLKKLDTIYLEDFMYAPQNKEQFEKLRKRKVYVVV